MTNVFRELPYTVIPNLLLLPPGSDIDQFHDVKKFIEHHNIFNKFYEIEMRIQKIIGSIENESLFVSQSWFENGLTPKRLKLNQATAELSKYIGTDSSNPLTEITDYWEKMDMAPAYSNKDLSKYRYLHRTYSLLLEIKKHKQYLQQWESNLYRLGTQSENGVSIKGSWQSFSSYSGRVTVKKLPLQSIPKHMKNYLVAPDGYSIASLDLNAAELRFLAFYANSKNMLNKFNSGEDIHSEIAELIQNVVLQTSHIDDEVARDLAKGYVFKMLYGASVNTIRSNLKKVYPTITTADVKKIGQEFDRRYPEINRFLLSREKSEKLLTIFGEVEPIALFSRTQKRNFAQQSGVSVIVKLLLIEVHKHFRILLVVHDELLFLIPNKEEPTEIINEITIRFNAVINDLLPDFPTNRIFSRKIIGGKKI